MPLTGIALAQAERFRYSAKGLGMIRKQVFKKGLKAARKASTPRPLTDEELNQFLKAGFRINDKQRGIYVHI